MARKTAFPVLLAAAGAAGMAMILYASRLGAGLTDDSYFYIQPGRAAAAGGGFHPSAWYAPLLPAILALSSLLGVDGLVSVRILNALLFGAVVVLAGLLVLRMSGSPGFALLVAVLTLTAENLLQVFPWAMSEPLYLVLLLAGLLALGRANDSGRSAWYWAAGITAGLAALSRYMAFMFPAAGVLTILLWGKSPFNRRFGRAAGYTVLGLTPIGLYILSNKFTTGTFFGPRGYAPAAYESSYTTTALAALLNWFLPGRLIAGREFLMAALVAAGTVGAAVWYTWRRRKAGLVEGNAGSSGGIALALGLFTGINLVFLLSLMFTSGIIGKADAFSVRYLSPVYLGVLILVVFALSRMWQAGRLAERGLIVILIIGLVGTYLYRAQDIVRAQAAGGMGYASERWHESETIRYLNNHPEVPLVSTASYGIYFWTGRLPRAVSEFSRQEDLQSYLRQAGGWLVLIDSMPPEMYGWQEADLLAGMQLVEQFSEGAVYQPAL